MSNNSYRHILKYTGVFASVQGLNILISLVRNKLVAVILGPDGMGLASLFNSAVALLSQSTNFGISLSGVRRLSELYDAGDEAATARYVNVIRLWSLLAALAGILLTLAVAPFLDYFSFSWGDHTLHFLLLAPAVAMLAVTAGETVVLKASRRLKPLASIQVGALFCSLLISVPLYYFFGESAIVPVIVLMGMVSMLLTLRYSWRLYPLRLQGAWGLLHEGFPMIRLGVAFILAGIVGSAAEMAVRAFLNVYGGLDDVGLYNAAYMITVTYAGMVFSAFETDYFPRLSAVNGDVQATNLTVNKQMEVSLLLLAPMLTGLLMFLPLLIPALFSSKFLPIVSMTQLTVLAMYLKVLTLPVAYITLARGRSLSYLLLESSYFVVFTLLVMLGFRRWGLYGAGVGLVAAHVFDYLMINGYAYWKFGYRSTWAIGRYAAVHVGIGLLAFVVSCVADGWVYWTTEAALAVASTAYSVRILYAKTHLWSALTRRFRRS